MKSRKLPWLRMLMLAIMIVSVVALVFGGCAKPESGPTEKTLKIGYCGWYTAPPGIDFYHAFQVMVKMVNDNGGLAIGKEKYNIELIAYDSSNVQTTAVAAANRLIFEDKVKFIIADTFVEAYLKTAEDNKVLLCGYTSLPDILSPDNHYSFMPSFNNSQTAIEARWWVNTYPDKKKLMLILPDVQLGHIVSDTTAAVLKNYDLNIEQMFYPLGATDLSALGTKVKTSNPDAVSLFEMSPLKPIRQAGWDGQLFSFASSSTQFLLSMATADALEGYIGMAYPTEFDPPLTKIAQDFKEAYTTEFKGWTAPDLNGTGTLSALLAALQQAKSTDIEKVAAVLAKGMSWEGPTGPAKMVSRPDLGNSRTVDSVTTIYFKQIKDGKPVLLDTVNLDKGVKYFEDYLELLGAQP
jgi:branched-chain amino acid transport system substrate-binding protein